METGQYPTKLHSRRFKETEPPAETGKTIPWILYCENHQANENSPQSTSPVNSKRPIPEFRGHPSVIPEFRRNSGAIRLSFATFRESWYYS